MNGVICFLGKASSFEEEDGTGVGRNEIRVQVGRGDHGANFICRAENEATAEPLQSTVQLSVDRKLFKPHLSYCELKIHEKATHNIYISSFAVSTKNIPHSLTFCLSYIQTFFKSTLSDWAFFFSVRPFSTEIIEGSQGLESAPVAQGETVSLMCRTYGARPAATITWYNGTVPFYQQPAGQIALKVTILVYNPSYL